MEIKNIQIRKNSMYPEIINASDSSKTVAILQDLLSSRQGELAGVMQYFYQAVLANQFEQEIGEILEEISVVEMEHVELLMNAIVAFGGNPKYDNSRGQPFNTSYINYSSKLKDILEANIIGEQIAIREYTNAINLVDNKSLKDLLARIIEDEQLHLNTFKNLKNTTKFLSI